jgi:hypothetical protein
MAAGFSVTTGSAFAVTSGAKTLLNLLTGATNPPIVTEFSLSFDGVTATAVPVLVELCASTQATAGTAGSVGTIVQVRGFPSFTAITTVAGQYTAEPTVLTPLRQWFVPAFMGMADWQMPLGREIQGIITASTNLKGIAFRVSAPAAVNTRGYAEWEE